MIYEFAATQDLHGYDKPWAPAGGANQLPNAEAFTQTINGVTLVSNGNGEYHLSGTATGGPASFTFPVSGTYDLVSGDYLHIHNLVANGSMTISLMSDASTIRYWGLNPADRVVPIQADDVGKTVTGINFYVAGGLTIDLTITPSLEAVSSVTDFTPYSNVCPPEGFNIWDPTAEEFIQVYAGYVNANTRELYLRPVYEEYAGEELVGPWMSSMDEYSEDATPTEGAFVIDFGGELTSYEITPFMLQTLLDSLGIRQHFTDGAGLLNSLMDQAQGRVRSEEELLHLSRPLKVIAIGDQLPASITFKPISKDVLPGLPGKFIR